MIPTLFPANYIPPTGGNFPVYPPHGEYDLVDAIECYTKQSMDNDTAEWELEMKYPANGMWFNQLEVQKIILAKANTYQNPQAFRIYSIQKTTDKTVTVKGQHISYDLMNIPMKPFKVAATKQGDSNSAVRKVMNQITSNELMPTVMGVNNRNRCFYMIAQAKRADNTYYENRKAFKLEEPKSVRAVLFDGEDSVKGTYGGDFVIDNYHIVLYGTHGSTNPADGELAGYDRGIVIDYGIDLIDLDQEDNIGEMFTGVLPYYRENKEKKKKDDLDEFTYGSIVDASGNFPIKKIAPVDLSSYFSSKPKASELNSKAETYIYEHKIGEPEVSLKVTYAYLKQDVRMFDAILVRFPKLGVSTKAKVVAYKYNVLLDRVEEIELGHAKSSKYFRLMDASRIRKGLLPAERIGKESIRGGAGGHIAKGSIDNEDYAPESIDHDKLAKKDSDGNGPIRTDNMSNGAVNGDIIKPGAVNGGRDGHIAKYTVEPDFVLGNNAFNSTCVTRVFTAGSIEGAKITKNTMTIDRFKEETAGPLADIIQHYTQ